MTIVRNNDFPISIKSNDLDFCNCIKILDYNMPLHCYGYYHGDVFVPIISVEYYDWNRGKFDIIMAAMKKEL